MHLVILNHIRKRDITSMRALPYFIMKQTEIKYHSAAPHASVMRTTSNSHSLTTRALVAYRRARETVARKYVTAKTVIVVSCTSERGLPNWTPGRLVVVQQTCCRC